MIALGGADGEGEDEEEVEEEEFDNLNRPEDKAAKIKRLSEELAAIAKSM